MLGNLQFSVNQSIWSLVISSFLAKLVPACVTSDVVSLTVHMTSVNRPT